MTVRRYGRLPARTSVGVPTLRAPTTGLRGDRGGGGTCRLARRPSRPRATCSAPSGNGTSRHVGPSRTRAAARRARRPRRRRWPARVRGRRGGRREDGARTRLRRAHVSSCPPGLLREGSSAPARQRLRALGAAVPRGPRPTTRANPAELTARELDVLRLVVAGKRNAEIADELVLSRRTVDHHVSAILRKLDVRSRGEATVAARERGLLDPA